MRAARPSRAVWSKIGALERLLADLDQQVTRLADELAALKAERAVLERRVSLLRAESIDADMLDERARALLNYSDPRELTLPLSRP